MSTRTLLRHLASLAMLWLTPQVLLAKDSANKPLPRAAAPTAALRSLSVEPAAVTLEGPRDQQQLIVTGAYADGRLWDWTRRARLTIDNRGVATVDARGVVQPVADGDTTLRVEAQGRSATVSVHVRHATGDIPVDFAREIVPVLTKAGCNQGACHGAALGRGGFRLSLLGYDPAFDYAQIVQSAEGRRVVVSDPERSILLQKPTLTMEHGGGERFPVGAPFYDRLRQWLEDGAPAPRPDDPVATKLDVFPVHRVMVPGEEQQLMVRAIWADGRQADVTATAQYDSLSDGVAGVTSDGLVTARDRGETHIMIRFAGQATVMQVTAPYAHSDHAPKVVRANFIDDMLAAKWAELGLTPSPLCTDEEFLRRLYLDTIGTLPTPDEIKVFLADHGPDKRRRAVERVLDRPEFVDFWALKWGDLLRINRDQLNEKGMWSFYNWVRASLRDNRPVDEFVRELITAEGSTYTDGPANFYRTSRDPADWSETTCQLFLGIRMQCAKCHHHPFEKWSQDDYYGMQAFFVRLGTKRSQEFGIFGQETVVYLRPGGEQPHPKKGGVVRPHPLDGPVMDDPFDRRRKLAEWVTAPENPYFARNIVNRFWGYFMGRGLVQPLDDMRATNPPSNPELLDALARDFVANHYDLKHLMRTILNSHGYQLSSAVTPGNAADAENVYYARCAVRRLTAEEMADALDFATGTREKYQGLPMGTRAIQLPDTAVRSFLLDVFGRPPRQVTCECERTAQPNIAQALHLLNGTNLNAKIASPAGRVERLVKAGVAPPEVVEELYLCTLSRRPRTDEARQAVAWLERAPSVREGAQDLLWVLLNSREFLFNH